MLKYALPEPQSEWQAFRRSLAPQRSGLMCSHRVVDPTYRTIGLWPICVTGSQIICSPYRLKLSSCGGGGEVENLAQVLNSDAAGNLIGPMQAFGDDPFWGYRTRSGSCKLMACHLDLPESAFARPLSLWSPCLFRHFQTPRFNRIRLSPRTASGLRSTRVHQCSKA